jgi:preprotein translocase subunit YajC
MFISAAYAATAAATSTAAGAIADAGAGAGAGQAFGLNVILIVIMVGLFYFMMIVPQQKRMRRHRDMMNALRKGDKIITGGGLLGVIDKIKDGEDEVTVDFGNGVKIQTQRSMIELRPEPVKADSKKDTKKDVK